MFQIRSEIPETAICDAVLSLSVLLANHWSQVISQCVSRMLPMRRISASVSSGVTGTPETKQNPNSCYVRDRYQHRHLEPAGKVLTTLVSHLRTPRSACSSDTFADGTRLEYSTIGGDLEMLEFQRILLRGQYQHLNIGYPEGAVRTLPTFSLRPMADRRMRIAETTKESMTCASPGLTLRGNQGSSPVRREGIARRTSYCHSSR